jgi:predicted Zn finger-like uncharacterized protein
MKISCQSCQSKYNVADEKVQGKIVKIRCRKCGATIVVNGAGGAAANGSGSVVPEMPAHSAAAEGGDQWHVNVNENDQRSMSLAELVEAYNAGAVTQETFIWTDGMDDWKPLSEVDVVVTALHAHADQAASSAAGGASQSYAASVVPAYEPEPAPAARTYEAPPPSAPSYGSSFGAQASVAAAEPRRAAVVKREARARDLFGTAGGDEVQTSAPSMPHATSQEADDAASKLTGERNENSVLFSLAVLTQGGDERSAHEAPSPTQKDDSGLIDLRALAARSESMRPVATKADGDVFAPPLGFTAPPLGAPLGALGSVGGDAQAKSKLPLFIGIGAGAILLVVASVVIGVKVGASNTPVPSATVMTVPVAPTTPEPTASATAEATASAAPSASAASGKPKAAAGGGGYHPPAAGAGGKPAAPAAAGGPGGGAAPSPAPAAAPKKNDCGCNGDLMCLMKCSTH